MCQTLSWKTILNQGVATPSFVAKMINDDRVLEVREVNSIFICLGNAGKSEKMGVELP